MGIYLDRLCSQARQDDSIFVASYLALQQLFRPQQQILQVRALSHCLHKVGHQQRQGCWWYSCCTAMDLLGNASCEQLFSNMMLYNCRSIADQSSTAGLTASDGQHRDVGTEDTS